VLCVVFVKKERKGIQGFLHIAHTEETDVLATETGGCFCAVSYGKKIKNIFY
jgi:hypothetical protein